MLKIYNAVYPNGVDIATPSKFSVNVGDLDSEKTQRMANGILQRDIIRSKVRKLEMNFPALNREQMKTLLEAVNADQAFTASGITGISGTVSIGKGFFVLEYPDPLSLTNDKRIFYVGDRKIPMYDFSRGLWEGVSFNFIER
jgi:hypothetical protein